jgi:uncharacterized protein with HEPN domain
MLAYAAIAVELVEGARAEDLLRDIRTWLALERSLEILGEAAGKIPESVRARYPDLAWAQMTALRKRLAHAYFGTDHAVLHRIASELLPPMLPHLHEMVAQEGADRPSSSA